MSMFSMKSALGLGLGAVIALGAAFGAQAQQKSRLNQILERGTLRVGTTGDFNPMSIRDPATNSFKGLEMDAAEQLAKDLGVKLEVVPTDWPTLIAGITANRYDIFMGGSSMTVQRARVVGFSIPYMETGTVPIFDKKNAARFKDWDSINQPGVTVAVILGTVFEEQAKAHFPKATIKSVQPPATSFQEVLAGRADVAVSSSIDAAGVAARFQQLTHLPVDVARNKRPFGYVVAQDDPTWLSYMNAWVAIKKSEGFFTALETKWYSN
jgi:cyclohexadienyl dehydratase